MASRKKREISRANAVKTSLKGENRALSPVKRRVFLAVTLLFPFLLLGLVEISLRVADYGGSTPLFSAPPAFSGRYLAPDERVGARFFPSERFPPTPPNELFLTEKPVHGFRAFVLGESSAAGFPYPPNGMFSRVVADVLKDALPNDTVEIVNLGLAATNSYALVDFVGEILDQKPDAILIYGGHNEYYGALGVGALESLGNHSGFVRLYLRLQRLKTFLLLRNSMKRVAAIGASGQKASEQSPSRMESVARNQRIEFGGDVYNAGIDQFRSNLSIVLARFRQAGVPVFIGSLASNLRDQAPLAFLSGGGSAALPAKAAFDSATAAMISGDSVAARRLFVGALDLDVVRFRAPSGLNRVVKTLAEKSGAIYVPSAEALSAVSPGGIPGHDLILDHVHPTGHGYFLLGKSYAQAIQRSGILNRRSDFGKVKPWDEYERGMALTHFDDLIAQHEINTVTTRWPFVPFNRQLDYRGSYIPRDDVDSLAFFVSRGGMGWAQAKSRLAERYQAKGEIEKAVSEYDGLIRNFPHHEAPLRFAGQALLSAGKTEQAAGYLERAIAIQPSAYATYALGVISLRKRETMKAIPLLEWAVRLAPNNADALYQLSLAYSFSKNAAMARASAVQVYRLNPGYPGIVGWMRTLGLSP